MSIQTLVLQNVQYGKEGVEHLCKLVEESKQMVHFDISWAEFPKGTFKHVLEALSKNRRLCFANLSWNSLEDERKEDIQEKPSTQKRVAKRLSVSQLKFLDQVGSQEVESICKFIKYNKNLLHLNLENMSINKSMLDQLLASIKRARSLQSIHLSNNPCLASKTVIENISDTIHAKNELNSYIQMDERNNLAENQIEQQ